MRKNLRNAQAETVSVLDYVVIMLIPKLPRPDEGCRVGQRKYGVMGNNVIKFFFLVRLRI